MSLPPCFPDPERSQKLIDQLLDRVRSLDELAQKRLLQLIIEEADLPMLDSVERGYREKIQDSLAPVGDRDAARTLGNSLRAQFIRNLTLQREYLHQLVKDTLVSECERRQAGIFAQPDRG